jgi:hypothetical protein
MRITVFTSNQPRHIALINRLASISDTTFAVMECNTVFPGLVQDFFKRSDVMREYFSHVMRAEHDLFGDLSFSLPNVRTLPIKSGDLNFIQQTPLQPALESDVYIVFGASFIKGWLIDFLVERGALNIHMGVSPYYRGSSCNFWALYDNRPELVGATIHLLSKGLDSGPLLYHVIPNFHDSDPFAFTMRAVEAAQLSLVNRITSNQLKHFEPVPQNKTHQVRYTRNSDFTDEIAAEFLARKMSSEMLGRMLQAAQPPQLLRPFHG